MRWIDWLKSFAGNLFDWTVRTSEPGGVSQPLTGRDWITPDGRAWLNAEAKRVADARGITPLKCRQGAREEQFGGRGGPFGTTGTKWFFGDTNAAHVVDQCLIAREQKYKAGWIDDYLSGIMLRAAAAAAAQADQEAQ